MGIAWEPGRRYGLIYESKSGAVNARVVIPTGVGRTRDGAELLRAYCELREQERFFRVDRMRFIQALDYGRIRYPMISLARDGRYHIEELPEAQEGSPVPPENTILISQSWGQSSAAFDTAAAYYHPPAPAPVGEAKQGTPLEETSERRGGSGLGFIVTLLIAGVVAASVLQDEGLRNTLDEAIFGDPSPAAQARAAPVSTNASIPPPAPKPALEEIIIGGKLLRIRRGEPWGELYEVPSTGLVTMDKRAAIAAIRVPAFDRATGIRDAALTARYLAADLDKSGKLSFQELEAFQRKTYAEFKYLQNETALRPDRFVAEGGGDCEDFALYTAGLLRFWGWEPYLGAFGPAGGGDGHMVCLSFEAGSFPKGYSYFDVTHATAEDGTPLKSGRYVPIDYDKVGGLTNAVSPGWKLREFFIPESVWGRRM